MKKYSLINESTKNHKRMRNMLRSAIQGMNDINHQTGMAKISTIYDNLDKLKFLKKYVGANDPYKHPGFMKHKGKWIRIGGYDYDGIPIPLSKYGTKSNQVGTNLTDLVFSKRIRQGMRNGEIAVSSVGLLG